MLETNHRDPRAPGDARMYLYFDYSPLGALRWYVKVSRKGRRIGIREEYGTEAFDTAYDADQIYQACKRSIEDEAFRKTCRDTPNPYGTGGAGPRIAEILATVELGPRLLQKKMTY